MIFWSFFYLQVYLWIAGTALPEFKSIYGNNKNITSFLSLLEKNDGGSRSIRFFNGDSTHRGYHINVKFLPSQLVRRLFTLVCIVKKFEKILFYFCQLVREEIVPLLEDVFNQMDIQMEESQTGQAAILAASNENGGDSATLEEVVDQGYDQNQVGKSYGFRKPHKTRIHNSYCSPSS